MHYFVGDREKRKDTRCWFYPASPNHKERIVKKTTAKVIFALALVISSYSIVGAAASSVRDGGDPVPDCPPRLCTPK